MTVDEIPALEESLRKQFGPTLRVEAYGRGVLARIELADGIWSFASPHAMDIAALSMAEWRHRFADMLSQRSP